MTEIVLLSDPRVVAIPVRDCGEPLVDLRAVVPLRIDPRQSDPAGAYALLRSGVVDRLVTAQSLLPRELRLLVVEGYRPRALQARYFQRYAGELRTAHPDWSSARIRQRASRYIEAPEVAAHPTGGAVDLTLLGLDGEELAMGTAVNACPERSNGTCHTDASGISPAAAANRKLLGATLVAAGLVNYPMQWWHWSFGDRYWAFVNGARMARYGMVDIDIDISR